MKFNFIIIPLVIFATAYIGARFTKKGLHGWYQDLKKPEWTPGGQTIGEIWTFLYLLTGFAILWFWNVPKFEWWHWIVGGILLINAGMNAYWNKLFFVDHAISKSLWWMKIMNATTVIAAGIMAFSSLIAAVLFVPYIVWVGIATKLTSEIKKMNNI